MVLAEEYAVSEFYFFMGVVDYIKKKFISFNKKKAVLFKTTCCEAPQHSGACAVSGDNHSVTTHLEPSPETDNKRQTDRQRQMDESITSKPLTPSQISQAPSHLNDQFLHPDQPVLVLGTVSCWLSGISTSRKVPFCINHIQMLSCKVYIY